MGLKRTIAKVKIEKRKRERTKRDEDIRKLGLERNKALQESYRLADLALAKEQAQAAKIKKMKAEERLELTKQKERQLRQRRAEATNRKIKKVLGKIFRR